MALEVKGENTIKLRSARAQLGLTQEELGNLAGLHYNIISRCERGIAISSLSAWAILNALNGERTKRNLPLLEYEQMEWEVQGYGKKSKEK